MTPGTVYVHAASLSPDSYHKIAATGGYASISTESECNAGQGYSPTWKLRKYGIPVSLSNGHQRLVERRHLRRDARHAQR